MASIAGVRLPEPGSLKGKGIGRRIRVLAKYATKVYNKTHYPGLDEDEALVFVRHWRPAFGSLKLLRSQPSPDGSRDLKLAVDFFVCHHCRLEFDEKDLKSICAEGVMCPKCGEVVLKKQSAAPSCEGQPGQKPPAQGEQK
jgi:hypothetical protein